MAIVQGRSERITLDTSMRVRLTFTPCNDRLMYSTVFESTAFIMECPRCHSKSQRWEYGDQWYCGDCGLVYSIALSLEGPL